MSRESGTVDGGARVVEAQRNNSFRELGNEVSLLVSSEDTGGGLALVQTRERRGSEPPCHLHTREDELVYVLEGELTFHVGDEPVEAIAGTCVWLPRGTDHCFSVDSQVARLLVMLVPGGYEGYLREMDRSQAASDALAVERMVATAARYGVEITGPPPAEG